jgi:hypothetical protein
MNNDNDDELLWYQNPLILFKNIDQIYPYISLSIPKKINSIARLALYFLLFIYIFSFNKLWIIISLILFLISYNYELYFNNDIIILNNVPRNKIDNHKEITYENINCTKPLLSNPFMNYTLGNHYENVNKLPACSYEDVKLKIKQKFRSSIPKDSNDIWGHYISDRNFYTMPNTNIVNNQVNFSKWCYSTKNSGECKSLGSNCIKYRNPKYHIGRLTNI